MSWTIEYEPTLLAGAFEDVEELVRSGAAFVKRDVEDVELSTKSSDPDSELGTAARTSGWRYGTTQT